MNNKRQSNTYKYWFFPPYLIIAQVLLLTYLPNLILGWDIIGSTIDPQKREQLSNFQDSSNNQRRKSKILLIGNEGEGVAKSLLDKCNSYTCLQPRLNINTLVDSLNVSVATALLIKQQMKWTTVSSTKLIMADFYSWKILSVVDQKLYQDS